MDSLSRRIPLLAALLVALPLLLASPVAAGGNDNDLENLWDGVWKSHHKDTHLMMLNLDQKKGKRKVTGHYRHPHDTNGDKGTIHAEAEGKYGRTLVGRYKSTNGGGGGGFKLHMKPSHQEWEGEFWPCRYRWYCSVIDWHGAAPGFGD